MSKLQGAADAALGIRSRVGSYRWTICGLLFFAATINYLGFGHVSAPGDWFRGRHRRNGGSDWRHVDLESCGLHSAINPKLRANLYHRRQRLPAGARDNSTSRSRIGAGQA